jgi:hypothetical protein
VSSVRPASSDAGLDADKDGELSPEMPCVRGKKLDRNSDGILNREELRPQAACNSPDSAAGKHPVRISTPG